MMKTDNESFNLWDTSNLTSVDFYDIVRFNSDFKMNFKANMLYWIGCVILALKL